MEFTKTSKNSCGVEKMQTIQNFEKFAAFNCLLVNFWQSENQPDFDAMNGDDTGKRKI